MGLNGRQSRCRRRLADARYPVLPQVLKTVRFHQRQQPRRGALRLALASLPLADGFGGYTEVGSHHGLRGAFPLAQLSHSFGGELYHPRNTGPIEHSDISQAQRPCSDGRTQCLGVCDLRGGPPSAWSFAASAGRAGGGHSSGPGSLWTYRDVRPAYGDEEIALVSVPAHHGAALYSGDMGAR